MRAPTLRMSLHAAASLATALLTACGGGGGGSPSTNPNPNPSPSTFTDPTVYSVAANASLQAANEIVSVTQHSQVLGGATLDYTATAGHLTALALGTGAPRASFFYVAYTLNGAAPASRPVTFFYNGGPGSATVWLHLGSFGPRRLDARAPLHDGPTPFPLVENAESMLDLSDLVFVDAVGAGYSQAIAPNTNSTFWGVRADAEVFRDFVMRYVIVNQRETSPRFLFGESYGTTRAALHARLLEQAGMPLRGVVLQSSVLDYSNNCGVVASTTVRCTGYLPSYFATSNWFGRDAAALHPGLPFPERLDSMRVFAQEEYDPALQRFLASATPPDPMLLTKLRVTTGIGEAHWTTQFNMGPSYYRVNFMPGTLLGRYDSRVTQAGGTAQNDPSSSLIGASFAQGMAGYLKGTLGYTTPSVYTTLSNAIQAWDFSHDGRPVPDVIPDLAAAMTLNPRLQVLAVSGMHDLATPFYTTEQDLARLGANPNVTIRNYIGGHMTYLDNATRVRQKADLADWYRRALQ